MKRFVLTLATIALCLTAFGISAPDIKALQTKAEAGDAKAEYDFACLYLGGEYAPEDTEKARIWLRKSAEKGNAQAQVLLAGLIDQSAFGTPNYAESEQWFLKAATQGDARAQFALGKYYGEGRSSVSVVIPGMRKNADGLKWMLKSADQGLVLAWNTLAEWYFSGNAGHKDLVEAYKWICISFENGEIQETTLKAQLEKQLTPEQRSQAEEEAKEWLQEFHERKGTVMRETMIV